MAPLLFMNACRTRTPAYDCIVYVAFATLLTLYRNEMKTMSVNPETIAINVLRWNISQGFEQKFIETNYTPLAILLKSSWLIAWLWLNNWP